MTTTSSTSRAFVSRNDKTDAAQAAALIHKLHSASTPAASGLAYAFSIAIESADWNAAHATGAARTAIAKARGRSSGIYRRGDADERIDTEGALAELALYSALGPVADYCAPLVEYKPSRTGLDLGLGGEHYDIKSMSQSAKLCCINQAQHFAKKPRGYICARIVSERIIDVYYVPASVVDGWKVFAGFTPYFADRLPAIIPLPDEEVLEE